MFRRKTKSAIFIDFDNIVIAIGREFGQSIPNWMAWLEDGKFDQRGGRRNFVMKRVYWNAHNDAHRPVFESNGFEAVTCRSIVTNKSTADMIIALDVLQSTYDASAIEEYVLLTTDTDFVPLVDRLGDRSKQTVNAANAGNVSFRAYSDHADIVITLDELRSAFAYERKRSFVDRLKTRWKARQERIQAAKAAAEKAAAEKRAAAAAEASKRSASAATAQPKKSAIDIAAAHIAGAGEHAPGLAISRKIVTRTLRNHMPEFATEGANAFLGCGSYNAMIEQIAEARPDLRLHRYRSGGRGISFRPED